MMRPIGIEEISIRNLGVIESALIEFSPGLNVLTGETGAGKTMVLTALNLILGGKSDSDKVRTGAERLSVSGRFAINVDVQSDIEDEGAEIDDGAVLISRTVTSEGKSRSSLGGVPVTAGKVSDLASKLVEVHAQSSSSRLTKPQYVRKALDLYGGHQELATEVAGLFHAYSELSQRIEELRRDQIGRESEIKKIREFLDQFNSLKPKNGEFEEIENEISRLSSVDELQQAVSLSLNILDNEDQSVISSLSSAVRSLSAVQGKDSELDEVTHLLSDSLYAAQEATGSLLRYLSSLDVDPARLDFYQERKRALGVLIKKFGTGSQREESLSELIQMASESERRISDLEGGDDRIEELQAELAIIFNNLQRQARSLSERRRSAAMKLQRAITEEIHQLAMPHATVLVEVETSAGTTIRDFSEHGIDDISLLFSSHEGSKPGVVSKIASGGELSRVMLGIEVVLSEIYPAQTLVFDEIDAGVGGKAAFEVGRRLARLSKGSQVIVVTHLAQVAVWADNHLVVKKDENGLVSASDVTRLSSEERSAEIARMLSGQEDSTSAREHAKELLEIVRESVIS